MPKNFSKTGSRTGSQVRPKTHFQVRSKVKESEVEKGFKRLWEDLFTLPTHLDSLLSKLPPKKKSILAQIVPTLLLRPVSQAQSLGIGIPLDEPWSLTSSQRAKWRPAELMAERLHQRMIHGISEVEPMVEDFPPEMIQEWSESWGQEVLNDLVDTLGRAAPLSLRVSRRVGAKQLLNEFTQKAKLPVALSLSSLSPVGIRLSGYAPVLNTEWYRDGAFEIQDEGSQFMSVFALWPERYGKFLSRVPGRVRDISGSIPSLPEEAPVQTVIDACAGAGGKALAFADALKGKGRVYAYDTSKTKLQALRRRATLARLNNIQAVLLVEGDEQSVVKKFKKSADLVLVDAPCTGWGVLRRNPDIKWRQKSDTLERLPKIQSQLLDQYSELVAPGGRLVYGVCTFRKEETLDIVDRFLKERSEFEALEGGFLGPGPCDGFFMQAMRRKS